MSDYWTVLFEFYMKNGYSSSILLRCTIVHYPRTNQSKYSNCTVSLFKYFEVNQDICMLLSSPLSTLNSCFGQDQVPIVMHDPMQYSGQTQIPCNSGQAQLTWTFKTWLRGPNPVSSLLPTTNTTVSYIQLYTNNINENVFSSSSTTIDFHSGMHT